MKKSRKLKFGLRRYGAMANLPPEKKWDSKFKWQKKSSRRWPHPGLFLRNGLPTRSAQVLLRPAPPSSPPPWRAGTEPPNPESYVLELGRTGAVTEALMEHGLREDRLDCHRKKPGKRRGCCITAFPVLKSFPAMPGDRMSCCWIGLNPGLSRRGHLQPAFVEFLR